MKRQNVDVGDGRLEAVVEGDGPVTVIFENGLATPLEFWDAIVPPIARRARTVRYDHRPASLTGPLRARSAFDIVGDLDRLLAALTLRPPYVLVGHSWGGVITRLFAHRHPGEVAGLVLVDATHEALDSPVLAWLPAIYSILGVACRARFVRRWFIGALCPPGAPPDYRAYIERRLKDPVNWPIGLRTARAEAAAIPEALGILRTQCPELPPVPIHVLTAGGVRTKSAARVHQAWEAAAARVPTARYTKVQASGHYMTFDAPGDVIDAIAGVLGVIAADLPPSPTLRRSTEASAQAGPAAE